ncbi:MAG TPA: phosphoribosylformylglycinamidine synthase subunit PurQ [Thermomicrobiales bacterium]|nr:phosphoribosylformylglycinamidine synthase subunit PurQ [Thermomicrobiales bacterium]
MRFGVIVFPGSNGDHDCLYALGESLGQPVRAIWHRETALGDVDCVVLPGGFAYGDYLRAGAIARFSPIMAEVERFARAGGPVLGICNGFQVLTEAGLLPGALLGNTNLEFRCQWTHIRVEGADTPFTGALPHGQVLRLPVAHGQGRYFAAPAELARLEAHGQVIFRYCDERGAVHEDANYNGSANAIAGVCSERRNVVGLMPHPERATEALLGGADGRLLFESVLSALSVR